MTEPRERLFRDEAGAAIERVARLEDENRRLRLELSRMSRDEREEITVCNRRPNRKGLVAFLVATTTLIVTWGALTDTTTHSHGRHSGRPAFTKLEITPPPQPIVIGASRDEAASDCSPPYTVDDEGNRRYKLGCLAGDTDVGPAVVPPPDMNDCSVPYWYAESGVKHYKKACLRR